MNYDNKIIHNGENSIVYLDKNGTCIKKTNLPKCYSRLDNEAQCLKILDGNIGPKLFSYNKDNHEICMEYIKGLTLPEYIQKNGQIPKYFFSEVVKNLLSLLSYDIEYGGDLKLTEHFLIDEERQKIRIIDFGISKHFVKDKKDPSVIWEKNYRRNFAFVFHDASEHDFIQSKEQICNILYGHGVEKHIVDQYFEDYDKI